MDSGTSACFRVMVASSPAGLRLSVGAGARSMKLPCCTADDFPSVGCLGYEWSSAEAGFSSHPVLDELLVSRLLGCKLCRGFAELS